MTDEHHQQRRTRLENCLQTILELEPEVERLDLGHIMREEYAALRKFMEKLDSVQLEEDDVRRIEGATERFLEELKGPLSAAFGAESDAACRIRRRSTH